MKAIIIQYTGKELPDSVINSIVGYMNGRSDCEVQEVVSLNDNEVATALLQTQQKQQSTSKSLSKEEAEAFDYMVTKFKEGLKHPDQFESVILCTIINQGHAENEELRNHLGTLSKLNISRIPTKYFVQGMTWSIIDKIKEVYTKLKSLNNGTCIS